MSGNPPSAILSVDRRRLLIAGDWTREELPTLDQMFRDLEAEDNLLHLDLQGLMAWDSRLSAAVLQLEHSARARHHALDIGDAAPALQQILKLATAVPAHRPTPTSSKPQLSPARVRAQLADVGDGFLDSLAFLGAAVRAVGRTLAGRGAMRRRELISSCFQAGPDALGIIALTSVLVGMILAYLGAAQLQQFGAAVYVADLVAIGMLREMGALMTAVVMAGRTGAAYAAQLSTMQANEEIDAISTLGIDPMEFLVVPRLIALICMMPLLVIFADALGIVGGALVAGGMGVTPLQYISQLEAAMSVTHFVVGLGKSVLFATLIALAGCRAGMSAGRNSAAVGQATTEAVVTAVVYLIIADAGVNIVCQQLGY